MDQPFLFNLKVSSIMMKKIEAIVRQTRFEDVKQALFDADINWFSYSEVKAIGHGVGAG